MAESSSIFPRKGTIISNKTMQFPISSLLFLGLILTNSQVDAFIDSPLHANRLRPSQQLTAFQVTPLLRFRDHVTTENANETPVTQPELQTISTSASQTARPAHSGPSMPLIRAIWFNQGAVLLFATAVVTLATFVAGGAEGLSSLHWNSGANYHSLLDWNVSPLRLFEGILATIPMVMIGCTVENSDKRDASQVNFSTVNMVISLFGRRESTRDPEATSSATAMALAALIALSTGISEEMVFRGFIPTGIGALSNSFALAVLGQAVLFALAHISPKSTNGENKIVGGLQFVNGLWYGFVYAASDGDIVPCIIAHTLYDMHVLCETWSVINNQLDYTQDAFQEKVDDSEEEALARIQQQAGPSLNRETLNFARRFFYAFDYEHKGSLCLSDVHRAVNYAFLKDDLVPEQEEVDALFDRVIETRAANLDYPGNRLTVSEFLRLLFALKSKGAMPA